jgi:hypothetical protein
MTDQSSRTAAREFAVTHLSVLATEVLEWRKQGKLPADATFDELARLCGPISSDGDEYQVAEQLVIKVSLESATRMQGLSTQLGELKRLIVDIGEDKAVVNLHDSLVERMGDALATYENHRAQRE